MSEVQPETLGRLESAFKRAARLKPNQATLDSISDTSLIELVAPAGEGKSSLMECAAEIDSDFTLVTGFTTRDEEARDTPGRYTYLTSDKEINYLVDRIEEGSVVQFVAHPTTRKAYGSFPEDYHSRYAMLDTLFNNVNDLDALPFKSIYKIAVVSKGNEWEKRFLHRYPQPSEERNKRLAEASLCLQWMIEQDPDSLTWLENPANQVDEAASSLILMTKFDFKRRKLPHLAYDMLERADKIAQ